VAATVLSTSTRAVPWWLVLPQGAASFLVGLLLPVQAGATLFALVLLLGLYWSVAGVADLAAVLACRGRCRWKLLSGCLGVLAGVAVLRPPLAVAAQPPATLVWLLGGCGVVIGWCGLVQALRGGGRGVAVTGLLSGVLGVILLVNPLASSAVLLYASATAALAGGAVAVVTAFGLRPV
jgi:uncharacterized membrane protein HdeD (DUF308 family)